MIQHDIDLNPPDDNIDNIKTLQHIDTLFIHMTHWEVMKMKREMRVFNEDIQFFLTSPRYIYHMISDLFLWLLFRLQLMSPRQTMSFLTILSSFTMCSYPSTILSPSCFFFATSLVMTSLLTFVTMIHEDQRQTHSVTHLSPFSVLRLSFSSLVDVVSVNWHDRGREAPHLM